MAIVLDGNNQTTSGLLNSLTMQGLSGGTSYDYMIPSGVKRITIMFYQFSTNGTSVPQILVGAGSFATTGYVSTSSYVVSGSGTGTNNITSGFGIYANATNDFVSGHMILTNMGSNMWIQSHAVRARSDYCVWGGGDITLSGTLDRVRLTTVNGTDTYDNGYFNLFYE